jgi:hypothetical protein
VTEPVLYPTGTRAPFGGAHEKKGERENAICMQVYIGDYHTGGGVSGIPDHGPFPYYSEENKKTTNEDLNKPIPITKSCIDSQRA